MGLTITILTFVVGLAVLVGVLVIRGQRLGRVGGALLLIGYGAYLWNKAM